MISEYSVLLGWYYRRQQWQLSLCWWNPNTSSVLHSVCCILHSGFCVAYSPKKIWVSYCNGLKFSELFELTYEIMDLSPSINSIFKHACAAIHWRCTSDFWSDPTSMCVSSEGSGEPLLFAYAISTIITYRLTYRFNISNLTRSSTKPTKWCVPSEDSDQPGHLPSLIRVFAVRTVDS